MLKIRLRRQGSHARPFYRVVVSDQRKRPEGRVLAEIGHFDPMKRPKVVDVDLARWEEWIAKGAQPSETVRSLVAQQRRAEAAGISLASPAGSASARRSTGAKAPAEPAAAETATAVAEAPAEESAETPAAESAETPAAESAETPAGDESADEKKE